MKVRIKDLTGFANGVFGADCFLENFPEIKTTGVEVEKFDDWYYIMEDGEILHDSTFFSEEEMKFLEVIS